ncbi:hypothetical protein [Nocardiopsis sp. LDBS1602]|uniref:hypothetical protein n=1 Tax=Nocardiopsis sp. LDBS1602 TaxID=3109597 RepID=UPI002DB80064|nr:hypothetical protein [Nocardiopsis sp. LDBS1602]MEC3891132.1 hypothetical protein [Nocardiopsis sp. LDBS1602]
MTDTRERIPEEPADERWGPSAAYSDPGFPEELSVAVHTDPSPLVASGARGPANLAGLSVMVTNVGEEAVRAHAILIRLEVSKEGKPEGNLLSETWSKRGETVTRKPKTRSVSDDGLGTYTFTYSGGEGAEPFKPGETVSVAIHDIPVSAMAGVTSVDVGVEKKKGGDEAWNGTPLGKFPAGYYLRELRADTNPVEYGESVTLTWLEPPIEGIRYTLLANREEIKLNEDHPQPVKISGLTTDTTFELKPSWSEDVRDRQSLLVRVTGGDIAARNVSVKSSLTVREGVPLLLRSEWHEFSWCSPRQFSREATDTGTIITNFQLRPDTGDRSGVVFIVEDSEQRSVDVYEVALGRNANWLQGYGFAYAYEGFRLTLTLWNIEANARPDLGFRPAFAYL